MVCDTTSSLKRGLAILIWSNGTSTTRSPTQFVIASSGLTIYRYRQHFKHFVMLGLWSYQSNDRDTFCLFDCKDRLRTPDIVKRFCDCEQHRIPLPNKRNPLRRSPKYPGPLIYIEPIGPFRTSMGRTQEDHANNTLIQRSPIGCLRGFGCLNQTLITFQSTALTIFGVNILTYRLNQDTT